MTFTRVVLPAPFGPISPWIDPCSTSSDTPSTARTPPKCRWTSSRRRSTCSRARQPGRTDQCQASAADDALRPKDDDGDQESPADHVDVGTGVFEDVREQRDDHRADDRPEHESAAAEDREREHLDRTGDAVLRIARIDEEVEVRLQSAGVTGDDGAEDERDHLVARDEDALAQRRDLVLADRRPCVSEPALGQAPDDEDDDRKR